MFQTMSNAKNIPIVLIRDCNIFFYKRRKEERTGGKERGMEERKRKKEGRQNPPRTFTYIGSTS